MKAFLKSVANYDEALAKLIRYNPDMSATEIAQSLGVNVVKSRYLIFAEYSADDTVLRVGTSIDPKTASFKWEHQASLSSKDTSILIGLLEIIRAKLDGRKSFVMALKPNSIEKTDLVTDALCLATRTPK